MNAGSSPVAAECRVGPDQVTDVNSAAESAGQVAVLGEEVEHRSIKRRSVSGERGADYWRSTAVMRAASPPGNA